MDVDLLEVPVDDAGRLTGAGRRRGAGRGRPADGVFAVVATAGTTNLGIVDDLDSVGRVCAERGLWFHVDGAYGGAGLAAPSVRPLFAGIERADSFVVDPHKWLFAPFDCCALVYRDPEDARPAHTQHAGYLDVLTDGEEMNPSDYAIGLTRRARGLPFWFSLAVHGTQAYTEAVERTLAVARYAADEIRRREYLELLHEPDLSVVVFRRLGWDAGRLPRLVGADPQGRARLRRPDDARGRDRQPVRRREPASRPRPTSPRSSTRWPDRRPTREAAGRWTD